MTSLHKNISSNRATRRPLSHTEYTPNGRDSCCTLKRFVAQHQRPEHHAASKGGQRKLLGFLCFYVHLAIHRDSPKATAGRRVIALRPIMISCAEVARSRITALSFRKSCLCYWRSPRAVSFAPHCIMSSVIADDNKTDGNRTAPLPDGRRWIAERPLCYLSAYHPHCPAKEGDAITLVLPNQGDAARCQDFR